MGRGGGGWSVFTAGCMRWSDRRRRCAAGRSRRCSRCGPHGGPEPRHRGGVVADCRGHTRDPSLNAKRRAITRGDRRSSQRAARSTRHPPQERAAADLPFADAARPRRHLSADELRKAVAEALYLRLTSQGELERTLKRLKGHRGAGRLGDLIGAGEAVPTRSELERALLPALAAAGVVSAERRGPARPVPDRLPLARRTRRGRNRRLRGARAQAGVRGRPRARRRPAVAGVRRAALHLAPSPARPARGRGPHRAGAGRQSARLSGFSRRSRMRPRNSAASAP